VQQEIGAGRLPEAITRIQQGRDVLQPQERTQLTRQAVQELAHTAELRATDIGLREVRQLAPQVRKLDPELGQTLEAVEARLEARSVAETVEAVREPAAEGRWRDAAERAQESLRQREVPTELAGTLKDVVRFAERQEALKNVSTALGRTEPAALAQTARSLLQASRVQMSRADWSPAVGELAGVRDLQAVATSTPTRPPSVPRLKENFADLRTTLDDPNALIQEQQDLACKVLLDGFPGEARQLLPEQESPEHARYLLRDLKAMALGKGSVRTWPAEQALPAKGGIPRGLKPLVPEGEAGGWRPPVRESPLADLPSAGPGRRTTRPERLPDLLDRMDHAAKERVSKVLTEERETIHHEQLHIAHTLHVLHQQQQQEDQEERDLRAKLEKLLGRKLSSAEWALAWHLWRHKGKQVNEVADALRKARFDPPEIYDADMPEIVHLNPQDPSSLHRLSLAYAEPRRGDLDGLADEIAKWNERFAAERFAAERFAAERFVHSPRESATVNWFRATQHEALARYAEAITYNPREAANYSALAWRWATCPDRTVRIGPRAVEFATRACELSSWKDPNCIHTLAAAYAEVGEFDEAVKWEKKALETPGSNVTLRDDTGQRLKGYQERKPYRAWGDPAPTPTRVVNPVILQR
jgi:hypothetical protein